MLAMATIPLSRNLSNNADAVRKRHNRVVQREKRRRTSFVHEYVRTKYPNVYTEANAMYQALTEKYPEKMDFTKLYYFKKWQKSIDLTRHQLYIPHLPVLCKDLFNPTKDQQEDQDQQPPYQEEPQQEDQQQQPPYQEEPQQEDQQQPPYQEEPQQEDQQQPPYQEEPQQEDQQQPPYQEEPQQEDQDQQPPYQEEPQQEDQQQPPQQSDNLFSGMSINEMNIAVDDMIKALQSDRELMDIVEGFDLPDAVWDNELSIPDYVLESDLEW